jgi:hypothetical protein
MFKHCHSRSGFLLLGIAALFAAFALFTLFSHDPAGMDAFFGLSMFSFATGIPGLFQCLRAAEPVKTDTQGLTAWLNKTVRSMACCESGIAAALNAIALIFLGITLLMAADAWFNADPEAQDGAMGSMIMTALVGLAGIMACKPRQPTTEVPRHPVIHTPMAHPTAQGLGNLKVMRLACPACNASIPANLWNGGQTHLNCPYCGTDVVVQETEA